MLNAQFHLFQEAISQFTVVIVLENTNQMIQVMKDHLVTTEAEDHHMGVIQAGIILDRVEEKVINF